MWYSHGKAIVYYLIPIGEEECQDGYGELLSTEYGRSKVRMIGTTTVLNLRNDWVHK